MLSKRQLKILMEFCSSPGAVFSSQYFSDRLGVSIRTVKADFDMVKEALDRDGSAVILSMPSKGSILKVLNQERFQDLTERIRREYSDEFPLTEQPMRVKLMISRLLGTNQYLTKEWLEEEMAVSESTLYLDMKLVRKTIEPYQLTMSYESGRGYKIGGLEKNKRQCLIKENIYTLPVGNRNRKSLEMKTVTMIEEIIVETLVDYEFKISDTLFRELIVYVVLSIERMLGGNFIRKKNTNESNISSEREYEIAERILRRSAVKLNFPVMEDEIGLLAIYLKGTGDYDRKSGIPQEVNDFITDSLSLIHQEFSVDFTGDVELNIFLCLHFIPLLTRLQNDMQLDNEMLNEIKQSFPFAFDIAIYFSLLIQKRYGKKIVEGEISYFALCFAYGLENLNAEENAKSILVITPLKQSETILIRQRINQWFKNQIACLDFVNQVDLPAVELQKYDAVFTTHRKLTGAVKDLAVRISMFPNEQDFLRMNMAINGYTSAESVLSKFHEDLVFTGEAGSKEDILERLLTLAEEKYELSPRFRTEILAREELGSTYFGNKIAIPHPLCPITEETFVVAGLLDREISWSESEKVRIVLMVSAEANNPKAFQLWHYLSSLVCNKKLVNELLSDLSYENLLKQLTESLRDKF